MKKSMKLLAAAASVVMAVSSIPAAAVSANDAKEYSVNYCWYNVVTKKYYNDKDEAIEASSAADVVYAEYFAKDCSLNFSLSYPYYSTYTKKYYPTQFAAQACSLGDINRVIFGGPDGSAKLEGEYVYYSTFTRRYYKTYSDALNHSDHIAAYVYDASTGKTYNGYSYYGYYSTYTGKYYSSYSAALAASKNNPNYIRYAYYKGYSGSGNYFNSKTQKWYSTLSAALAATDNANAGYVSYTGVDFTTYVYDGKVYASESEAKSAGGSDSNITVVHNHNAAPSNSEGYYTYSDYVVYNTAYSTDGYYYYNGAYYYGDPYYYYYTYGVPYYYTTTSTASADKDAEEGVPYLKGYPKKNSWTGLSTYIKNVKSGSTVEITMNGCETVPQTFLANLKGRNVTVVFYLSNGAKWTLKGTDITAANADKNIGVVYNITDSVPSSLVKKASERDNGKMTAQFAVSDGINEFGFKASCTVRFSADKAGSFAKTYLYDPDEKTLTLVSKSMVSSDGNVTFIAKEGGVYLVVLF